MRNTAFLAVYLSIFLCGNPARAQKNVNDSLPLDPRLSRGMLPNGLTYYIRENRKPEKKVELRLIVKVGSIVEDDDQQGLAHMAEHMAFNGTKNFKKNQIVSFLQDIGVGFGNDLNAYTGFDETVYILPIPTDKPGNIEKGFQVLEDWAHQVTYLDEDINSERGIILEESRLGKSGEERMFKKVYPELFKGSKYAERLPIGKDSIIRNFDPASIRRFYREWYRPDLMAVVVVGDIPGAKALELVKKHFSGLKNPAGQRPRQYAEVPPYRSSNAMVVTDREATGYEYALNYPAVPVPPMGTLGDYRRDLLAGLYTSMLNARFRETSQLENPPFVYAFAGFSSYARNHEAFNVSASTGTNDIRNGVGAVAEEIERVKLYGFTPAELDRAKKNMTSVYEKMYNNRDKTESSDLADEYIAHFTNGDPAPGIEKEFEYVRQLLPGIALDEVNAVTNRFRNEQNRFAYVMGPESIPGITLPTGEELLARINAGPSKGIKAYEEKKVSTELMGKRPAPGRIVSQRSNASLGTTELRLSNGITVTLKPTDFKTDQVLLNGARFGGTDSYGLADKYSAENAASVVASMGVGEFTPTDLKKALAGKNVSVSSFINQTEEGFTGNSGNRDLEAMFQLVHLYATEPRTDSALFKSVIQRNKSQYMMASANPQVAFIDTMFKVLYQNNPLTPTAIPKAEHFDKISMGRSVQIYRERLGDLSGMHFNIVGSFRESEIRPLLERYIASLPAGDRSSTFTDNKVRPFVGSKKFNYSKGKDDKSLIFAVHSGKMPYSLDEYRKLAFLSEVMNIKIVEEMREKIQGIYGGGTFAELVKAPYPHFEFVLQLPCGPEKVDVLLKEFDRELEELATKGPEQKYVDKVRKQWTEEYKTNMKTNEYWLGKLGQIRKGEYTTEQFVNWEKNVNAIKPADIRSAAKMVRSAETKLVAIQVPEK